MAQTRTDVGEFDENWRAEFYTMPTNGPAPAVIDYGKESVLQEAQRITQEQRREKYGPPAEDFAKVTGMAQALWGRGPETPAEHSLYMVLVKLAREVHAHQRDNLVDICGYIKTYEEIVEQGQ